MERVFYTIGYHIGRALGFLSTPDGMLSLTALIVVYIWVTGA